MFKTSILAVLLNCYSLRGADGVIQSSSEIAAVLSHAATKGGMTTAPISNVDQHRINVVNRVSPGTPLSHAGNSEVHYIMDGSGTVVVGGSIVRKPGASTGAGATIEGGQTRHVAKGDVVFVPAGVPHWYKDVDGAITYLEVRFEEGKK